MLTLAFRYIIFGAPLKYGSIIRHSCTRITGSLVGIGTDREVFVIAKSFARNTGIIIDEISVAGGTGTEFGGAGLTTVRNGSPCKSIITIKSFHHISKYLVICQVIDKSKDKPMNNGNK